MKLTDRERKHVRRLIGDGMLSSVEPNYFKRIDKTADRIARYIERIGKRRNVDTDRPLVNHGEGCCCNTCRWK